MNFHNLPRNFTNKGSTHKFIITTRKYMFQSTFSQTFEFWIKILTSHHCIFRCENTIFWPILGRRIWTFAPLANLRNWGGRLWVLHNETWDVKVWNAFFLGKTRLFCKNFLKSYLFFFKWRAILTLGTDFLSCYELFRTLHTCKY